MSFFGKLKSKLFKSSAKLEEGLDAIVQDDVAPEEAPAGPVSTDVAVQEAQPRPLRAHDPVEDSPLRKSASRRATRRSSRAERQTCQSRVEPLKWTPGRMIHCRRKLGFLAVRRAACWMMTCWSNSKSC